MPIIKKERKCIQIICHSTKALSGSTNNNATFNIDWGALLENNKPYYVSFTYQGGRNEYNGNKPASVQVNFSTNSFFPTAGVRALPEYSILGLLHPFPIVPNNNVVQLYADTETNSPCYLEHRPISNMLNIKILSSYSVLWTDNATTPAVPANWTIFLTFKEAITPLYETPKKITKLLFASFSGTGLTTDKFLNSIQQFFDKSKEYRISFTFIGGKPATGNYAEPILVYLDINTDAYVPNAIPFQCTSKSGYIGYIARTRFDTGADSAYLSSTYYTNEPVNALITYQPRIRLSFRAPDFRLTANLPSTWEMIVSFEEV